MKILSVETIETAASLALLEDGVLVAQCVLEKEMKSAQYLIPAAADLFEKNGWKPEDVQLVAVAVGPGSFTGLRVGITFAKLFAYSVQAQVFGFNTLDVIARGVCEARKVALPKRLSIGIDAQRGQVMVRDYQVSESGEIFPEENMRMEDFRAWATLSDDSDTLLAGPVLFRGEKLLEKHRNFAERETWNPSVVVMGEMAWESWKQGKTSDIWNILPIYSRLAAAEERKNSIG